VPGGCPEQIDAQNAAVEQFNATHDDIELVIEIVQNDVAYDTLATQISSGNGPDIVGLVVFVAPTPSMGAGSISSPWWMRRATTSASGIKPA
jgi:ABC-type glycerol-3-phosphate transport system substrate-binding protein